MHRPAVYDRQMKTGFPTASRINGIPVGCYNVLVWIIFCICACVSEWMRYFLGFFAVGRRIFWELVVRSLSSGEDHGAAMYSTDVVAVGGGLLMIMKSAAASTTTTLVVVVVVETCL